MPQIKKSFLIGQIPENMVNLDTCQKTEKGMFNKKVDTAILIGGLLFAGCLADYLNARIAEAKEIPTAAEIQYVDRPVYVQAPQRLQYCVVGSFVVNQTINTLKSRGNIIRDVTMASPAQGNFSAEFLITYEAREISQ